MKRFVCGMAVAFAATTGVVSHAEGMPSAGRLADGVKISVDGRLDESAWTEASWNGPFAKLAHEVKNRDVRAQTSFAVLSDDRVLYVAVKCNEPDMAALKALPPRALYACDQVEVFLSPRGDGFDFYQFVVPFEPRNGSAARYASEGGDIEPDPFDPEWRFARGELDGGWCVEIAIPFSSLYMTRNAQWRGAWRVNVTRDRFVGGMERTSWSPLLTKYHEPANFRRMAGFPKRTDADDVGMTDVLAEISAVRDGKLAGNLVFKAHVAQGGDYEVSSPCVATTTVNLPTGANTVRVPCLYPENGRHATRIELRRKSDGRRYARTYPVMVDFEEIRLSLVSPEYRNNFYPGQDANRVSGRVETACSGETLVTLEGPGFPMREAKLPQGGGEIDFDTRGFQDGTAVLTVSAGGATKEFKIRKLAKTGRRMAWISNGRLVVDGKPVLRRGIYAQGYLGGKAFAERFAADKRLFLTHEVSPGGTLEPNRVLPGLETREARRDVVPCKEYFGRIDAMIEASKDRDFAYWYISDEPECRGLSQVYLKHVYEHVREKDPYHPILTATRAGKKYMDCADWFETHPYLNPYDDGRGRRLFDVPPSSIGSYVDAFDAQDRPDKCIGFLPTMFAYRMKSILNDYPTFPEYVCHTWAAIMRGAKTLWPYAYHDMGDRASLYEGNRYVNSTFAALEDFVLDGRRTTLIKTKDAECVRWDIENGESMFALANFTGGKLDIPLPESLKGRKWRPFRGQRAKGRALEPYQVVVGTTDERDAGLETYAETQKLVDGLEYERTHRDNQILEKYMSVGFASSPPVGETRFYKLIDGTRDVIGWHAREAKPWIELSFAERPVSFSRVRVYGSGIRDMRVSIRKGGEWKGLAPKSVKAEKYMRELDFGSVESTVKMRLSFPAAKGATDVELYEVEVPNASGDAVNPVKPAKGNIRAFASPREKSKTDALWSFGAENAKWAGTGYSGVDWYGGSRNPGVSSRDDGGFSVLDSVAHAVRLDPKYPWIELEVDSFAARNAQGYRAWWLRLLGKGAIFGTVTNPQTGLYVAKMPQVVGPTSDCLRFDNYNFDIGVKRLQCVRQPADFIVAESAGGAGAIVKGSVLDVTLALAAPCEDVAATFLIDHGGGFGFVDFPVNGTGVIEFKATKGGGGRVWKASIPVKSCGRAKARQVYVKCIVLGGALRTPLFGTVNQPFG